MEEYGLLESISHLPPILYDPLDDTVVEFAETVQKINKRNKMQNRLLILTGNSTTLVISLSFSRLEYMTLQFS